MFLYLLLILLLNNIAALIILNLGVHDSSVLYFSVTFYPMRLVHGAFVRWGVCPSLDLGAWGPLINLRMS